MRNAISLFGLQNKVKFVAGDARKTIPNFRKDNKETILSFAYFDFDLYEPTKAALDFIDDCISVGGIIVFDEACMTEWPGETLAMKETTKHHFEMLGNNISKQPTVAVKRVK